MPSHGIHESIQHARAHSQRTKDSILQHQGSSHRLVCVQGREWGWPIASGPGSLGRGAGCLLFFRERESLDAFVTRKSRLTFTNACTCCWDFWRYLCDWQCICPRERVAVKNFQGIPAQATQELETAKETQEVAAPGCVFLVLCDAARRRRSQQLGAVPPKHWHACLEMPVISKTLINCNGITGAFKRNRLI